MLSTVEIKNVKFSNSIAGYKKEDVDVFLDKVADDYILFERKIKESEIKIENCEKELNTLKESQASIQNVLLNAQNLADKMINEAREKSEEIIRRAEKEITVITERERELSAAFELKATERKNALEKELSDMVKVAQLKADSITSAANDSVARQQMLFDKLKLEIATFKSSITAKYKEHLEILNRIPETVPNDPAYLAKLVTIDFNKASETDKIVSNSINEEKVELKDETTENTPVEIQAEEIEKISPVVNEAGNVESEDSDGFHIKEKV